MQYLPTIDLWAPGITQALLAGQLRLQPGQWVRCGQRKPSRFSGVTRNGTIVATHPEGAALTVSARRFKLHLEYWKGRKC